MTNNLSNNFEIPNWAGKPQTGLHLDVLKDGKLIQKLMIDDKRCYLFGRNTQLNDFCIDHQSCSRIHAAIVYHKHLSRMFIIDQGSTHGTYIGRVRLEGHKPTPLPNDQGFHFGASTRVYMIRERPQAGPRPIMDELERAGQRQEDGGGLLGLPESETDLDNLTEFNTAHNRRIIMNLPAEEKPLRQRRIRVTFNEEEDVINPEDIDPNVGRFRNLIESTVVPKKRAHQSAFPGLLSHESDASLARAKRLSGGGDASSLKYMSARGLYEGLEGQEHDSAGLSHRLSVPVPNPAPDVDLEPIHVELNPLPRGSELHPPSLGLAGEEAQEPHRKKYAKEAWPGKKSMPSLLV
eukprot:snap_masked-scaffold646_size120253-processed-gene-0.4 protein:Tk08806 transcript:snap_masked-scaffold646_size120253-processed-gene-0.4-mRNA-1 annotation:"nuclear inhibitor of protein phosphatase 1"